MKVTWFAQEDGTIQAAITLTAAQQGPPNLTHGGASAALLDEAMGAAVWFAGFRVAAVNLNVNYHRPLPLGIQVIVFGKIKSISPRKILTTGKIQMPDGTVAVSAEGTYVEAP